MLLVGLGWEVSAQQSITPHPAQLPWWHPTAGWALCPGVSPLCPPAFLPAGFSSHCGAREGQDRGLGRPRQPLTLSLSPGELEKPDKHWGLGREDWNPEPQPGECPAPRATTLCLGDTPLQARVTPLYPGTISLCLGATSLSPNVTSLHPNAMSKLPRAMLLQHGPSSCTPISLSCVPAPPPCIPVPSLYTPGPPPSSLVSLPCTPLHSLLPPCSRVSPPV